MLVYQPVFGGRAKPARGKRPSSRIVLTTSNESRKGDDRHGHCTMQRTGSEEARARGARGVHRPAGVRQEVPGDPPELARLGEGRRGVRGALRRAQPRAHQQPQRLPGAGPAHARGGHKGQDPEAEDGDVLPRGPHRALLPGGPRARRRGGRDVRARHLHAQGRGGGGGPRRVVHVEVPGLAPVREPGLRGRRVPPAALRRRAVRVPVARRHLRQVPGRRALGLPGRRDRHRARRHGAQALPRRGLRRHRVLRRLEGVPLRPALPRRRRRRGRGAARRVGRPRGAAPGHRGVVPGGPPGSAASRT